MASVRHGYMFLRKAADIAIKHHHRHGTAFYRQLPEENVFNEPRVVQHCQALFHNRMYSSSAVKGLQQEGVPEPHEEVTEMPGNWVVKGLVLAMLTYIGMNVAPMMGENMVRHSVSLVKVKDPFMKRSGASRLTMIATDDEKRKRIVDAGGVKALMGMLETASDDDTRREALTTLATLAPYYPAVEAMHKAGGLPLVNTLSESATDSIILEHCSALLAKLTTSKA